MIVLCNDNPCGFVPTRDAQGAAAWIERNVARAAIGDWRRVDGEWAYVLHCGHVYRFVHV